MLARSVPRALVGPRLFFSPGQAPTVAAARMQLRYQSSQPSASGNFYKTFGRPILKVMLSAMFVYQVTYYTWMKLETDEITRDRQAEIADLEAKLATLQAPVETGNGVVDSSPRKA